MPLYNEFLSSQPQIVQSQYTVLGVDSTTTSTTFVDLMSTTVNTSANTCVVYFTASGDNSTTSVNSYFQLLIDGTPLRGTKYRNTANSGAGHSCILVCETPMLTAGAHVFKIQWLAQSGTSRIRPLTIATDHASLLIEEVTR
jgi:hypothetical protein